MKQKIWFTSLIKSEAHVHKIITSLKKYGLDVDGHFWEDDLENMSWSAPQNELLKKEVKMWLILTDAESISQPSFTYGLSLLTLSIHSKRGLNFPILILLDDDTTIDLTSLPSHFREVAIHLLSNVSWGAKIVATLHKTSKQFFAPYRLDVYGIPQIGQWFEVGPRDGSWSGAIFGTTEGSISLHAVGASGQLPEKSTLNFPQKGLKIQLGQKEFDGWAVQNIIDEKTSYFIKVDNFPESIMFCPYSQEDETEAYIIDLK